MQLIIFYIFNEYLFHHIYTSFVSTTAHSRHLKNVFRDCFEDFANSWVSNASESYMIEFNISFFAERLKWVFKEPDKCSGSFIITVLICVPVLKLLDSCQDLIWRSCYMHCLSSNHIVLLTQHNFSLVTDNWIAHNKLYCPC